VEQGYLGGLHVDRTEITVGERCVIDVAGKRGGDAVRPRAQWRVEDVHLSALRIEPAENPALPGEPEDAVEIEGRRVEALGGPLRRKRGNRKLLPLLVHPDDRVQPTRGDPRRSVWPDDYPMRRRARSERDTARLSGGWIEHTQVPGPLRGVPDEAVGRRRDVVRSRAGWQLVLLEYVAAQWTAIEGSS